MNASEDYVSGLSVEDVLVLFIAGPLVFGPAALVAVSGKWSATIEWAVGHQLLVPGSSDPTMTIPNADGAGLDVARLAFVAAVAVAIVVGVLYLRQRIRAWRLERLMRKGRV